MEPHLMGVGPPTPFQKRWNAPSCKLKDMDIIEIDAAFAILVPAA